MSISLVQRLGVCVSMVLSGVAVGQDYIERANGFYADITPELRSDLVILPVIGQMDEPPRGVETVEKAMLQPAGGSPVWREAEAWAQAAPQQAVLETLNEITQETDYRRAMAFGLPYGVATLADEEGGLDIVGADLYVELDVAGTPLLAGADFRYQRGVTNLYSLVHVEATRLAGDGKVGAALELLVDGVFFARQLADRHFAEEMIFGIDLMQGCLERMRDVVYLDLRDGRTLVNEQGTLTAVIDRLAERTREGNAGYIGVERMTFPMANRLAGDQLMDHVLTSGGVNFDTFVRTMAYMTSRGNPMMLFSQTPRWAEAAADLQIDQENAKFHVDRIHSDYIARWNLKDPHDPLMSQQTHYDQLSAGGDPSLVALDFTMGALSNLLGKWQQIRLEAMGTRHALSLAAYEYANNQHAPGGSSVRPRWLPLIEPDPLNTQYLRSNPSLQYAVPGVTITRASHTVNLVFSGYGNFQKTFTSDDFLLYSVGADGANDVAVEIQNTTELVPGADYLIWPPAVSLLRENLMTLGQLR